MHVYRATHQSDMLAAILRRFGPVAAGLLAMAVTNLAISSGLSGTGRWLRQQLARAPLPTPVWQWADGVVASLLERQGKAGSAQGQEMALNPSFGTAGHDRDGDHIFDSWRDS